MKDTRTCSLLSMGSIETFGRSTSKSGLNTRQLTFFCSTAFLTAFSRADNADRPVLTSIITISMASTEAFSPLKAIKSIGVPRKRMSLGSRSKSGGTAQCAQSPCLL